MDRIEQIELRTPGQPTQMNMKSDRVAFDARGMQVGGRWIMDNARTGGSLVATNATVGGGISMKDARIDGHADLGGVEGGPEQDPGRSTDEAE